MVLPMNARTLVVFLLSSSLAACCGNTLSPAQRARSSLTNAFYVQQQIWFAYRAEGVPVPSEIEAISAKVRRWWHTMDNTGPGLLTGLDVAEPDKPRRIVNGTDGVALAYIEAMKTQGDPIQQLVVELVRLSCRKNADQE
jgi:hypothetical protein